VLVWCKSCRYQAQDMQKMIDAGKGDVPLTWLRFRCSNCRSSLTDFVCTGRTAIGVQPWRPRGEEKSRRPVLAREAAAEVGPPGVGPADSLQ